MALSLTSFAYAQEKTVEIHLASPSPVALEFRDNDNQWWEACTGTCDRVLPANVLYRIAGPGITMSRKFVVDDGAKKVWINVKPGSSTRHAFGNASLVLGSIGLPIALNVMAFAALQYRCADCTEGFASTTTLNVGWTMLAVSAVAIVFGVIGVTSSRTLINVATF